MNTVSAKRTSRPYNSEMRQLNTTHATATTTYKWKRIRFSKSRHKFVKTGITEKSSVSHHVGADARGEVKR
ncbi:hypothetical protein PILCRDRAFT_481392 [Piloderma croceum F 1598]|uniref:Uncharacterized protein n=1 Tax=Piloderma croceum (strain F 1598) TaxID=765440 RepID=A0A0C3FS60_PILCF|nr:hypothetical protein PILCRDRAFT_481392 [Piloderma croceum F 1598]